VPASNKGWDKVDATLGVAFENGLEVYAYGLNLTDDRYAGQIYRLSPVVLFGSINAPLTYGVGIRYHF
jgi:iron complex outermembrane receptor protein